MKKQKTEKSPKKKFSFFRFIIKAILWLLLLLVIALVALYFYLGTIVKEIVTRYVPPITGTTAVVEHVDLSLHKGLVEIRGLKIGNPKGYSDNNIFELGGIKVTFQPKSVLTDKIIIDSIIISGTKVSAELKNLYSLDSNVGTLQQNINDYLGPSNKKTKKKAEKPQAKDQKSSGGKKVVIKDLQINDTILSLGASGKTVSLPLPNIQQKNIGEAKKEKSVGEIIADILNLLSWESVKGVANAAKDLAKQGVQFATDLAKQGIQGATDLVSSGTNAITDGAKGTIDGIKGLFK